MLWWLLVTMNENPRATPDNPSAANDLAPSDTRLYKTSRVHFGGQAVFSRDLLAMVRQPFSLRGFLPCASLLAQALSESYHRRFSPSGLRPSAFLASCNGAGAETRASMTHGAAVRSPHRSAVCLTTLSARPAFGCEDSSGTGQRGFILSLPHLCTSRLDTAADREGAWANEAREDRCRRG